MTTIKERENETRNAVAERAVAERANIAAPAQVADVDVSAVPETPAELLKQWSAPTKPLIHAVIAATLVRLWDALTGPGMTERQREQRAMYEHAGFANSVRRHF